MPFSQNSNFIFLAQENPYDDTPPPRPPQTAPQRPMSFSDLQQGFKDYDSGKTNDNSFRNATLILLAVIGLIALAIHLRQRQKTKGPPESIARLGREIGRLVRFPFGTRLLLKWVAHSSKVPYASLLISSALFDRCVTHWSRGQTFSVLRHWGKTRLDRLKPVLFD